VIEVVGDLKIRIFEVRQVGRGTTASDYKAECNQTEESTHLVLLPLSGMAYTLKTSGATESYKPSAQVGELCR